MIYPLKRYLKSVCKNPVVEEAEDAWTFPRLIPCGQCTICKKNKKYYREVLKNDSTHVLHKRQD